MSNCATKTVYYTPKEAKKAMKKLRNKTGRMFHYYPCQSCRNFHLSKTSPKVFRQKVHQR